MKRVHIAQLSGAVAIEDVRRALADLCAVRAPRIVRNADPDGAHRIAFEPGGGGTPVELTVAIDEDGRTNLAAVETGYSAAVITRLVDRFGGWSGRAGSGLRKIGTRSIRDAGEDIAIAWTLRSKHRPTPDGVEIRRKNALRAGVFVDDVLRGTIERSDVSAAERPWLLASEGRKKTRFADLDALFSSLDPERLSPGRANGRPKRRKSWNEVIQEMAAGARPEALDAVPPFCGSVSDDHERNLDLVRLDRLPDYLAAVEAEAARADDEFRSGDAVLWGGLGELLRGLDRHLRSAAAEIADRKAETGPAPKA